MFSKLNIQNTWWEQTGSEQAEPNYKTAELFRNKENSC
jgi:hypothetical protein